uniref:CSON001531 protein n=1 Tax=Culicoides sonorensis TaxID=179676 RepID=A0A336MN38_CULSO
MNSNCILITIIAFSTLFTVGNTLKCYHCMETHYPTTGVTQGNCSKSTWLEWECQGTAVLHQKIKQCVNRKDYCDIAVQKVDCKVCEKDLCNSAPTTMKGLGTIIFMSLIAKQTKNETNVFSKDIEISTELLQKSQSHTLQCTYWRSPFKI